MQKLGPRVASAALIAVACLLVAPAVGEAGEVSYAGGVLSIDAQGTLRGTVNEIFGPPAQNAFRITENNLPLTLVGDPPCVTRTPAGGTAGTECRVDDATKPVTSVDVDFGASNDQAQVGFQGIAAASVPWDFELGDGNDQAIVELASPTTISAGPGNDLVQPNNLAVRDQLSLGAGDLDQVTYGTRTTGVVVTINGPGVDGMTGAEILTGSRADDQLTGDAGPNQIYGEGGDDRLEGGAGQDFLSGDLNGVTGNADEFFAVDGEVDTINCGFGADTLHVDAIDHVGGDCPAPPPADADRDGDALPDSWEEDGVDTNGDLAIDLDLPAMGADPDHKDIFVEADYMAGHQFDQAQINAVVAAFGAAPVTNPDGQPGIALHVDNGPSSVMDPRTGEIWGVRSEAEQFTHQDVLGSDIITGGVLHYDFTEFDAIRQARLDPARRPVFHYAIAAHSGPAQRFAGIARGIPAADFIVAMHENCVPPAPTPAAECVPEPDFTAATFMHELGHTLGLHHGGTDEDAYKPNYISVMNYNFGFGLVLFDGSLELDYSRFDLPLDETALDEQRGFGIDQGALTAFRTIYRCPDATKKTIGILTQAVDWNCSGLIALFPVAANVSGDGITSPLTGPIDWDHIVYAGGGIGGLNAPPGPQSSGIDEPTPAELIENQELLAQGLSPQPGVPPPDSPPAALDTTAPETTIDSAPKRKLNKRKAKFTFSASEASSSFECKLDRKPFTSCSSPTNLKHLKAGKHRFQVRATDAAGNVDATPAEHRFKVVAR